MKGIDKKECRQFLEPVIAPSADCGLFLVEKLKYIIRTAVKIVGHRRVLILCLYARGDTPGGRPRLAYTLFQASDSFITYDHQAGTKTLWRTAMLENLERDYYFLKNGCAFYSRPDEMRVINFCKLYVSASDHKTGFSALSKMQRQLRDKETLRRQKNRERAIRAHLSGLNPLPCDLKDWLRRQVLPAYFFYDYRKGAKPIQGLCSACGQTAELTGVRHNAKGMCPHCGRELTMKSNGKRGHIWDRATASVVQKFGRDGLIVRVMKAYLTWPKCGDSSMNVYEEIRIIVTCGEDGKAVSEVYHHSNDSVGITQWKSGYPPVLYLYRQNFNAETCGALYCKNLPRVLKGTPWQYSQLETFYKGIQEDMEVLPYLEAYREVPAIEFFVKLDLFWLAAHVAYSQNWKKLIDPKGKNLREVLRIEPTDLPWLQRPTAGVRELRVLRILRREGHQPSVEFFSWLEAHDITDADRLERPLHLTTPHKLMRYLDRQFVQADSARYRMDSRTLFDYNDYLRFCEELQYDLKNDFVLFPKNLKRAHDEALSRIKQHQVEKFDPQIAAMQKELKQRYQFQADGLVVLPPHSAQEIVAEGQKLHHCLGDYAESMAKGTCTILFLRQEKEADKPFYTVEVQDKRIMQVRGAHNCAPTPEVKDFLDAWEKKKHLQNAA